MIYLDHNATTPLRPAARDAMRPFLEEGFANASSVHRPGQHARLAIEQARAPVAALAGNADASRVIFTSGGTEALNLALRGVARAEPRVRILASTIEHQAVRDTCADLARDGVVVEEAPVSLQGVLDLERFAALAAASSGPLLAVVMHANNETGVLQPIDEVARVVKARAGWLLVDAVQSAGKVDVAMEASGADMVALSAHKMGGPQGAGALVAKAGIPLRAHTSGGTQERNRRGGTENVAAIAGFGAAAREARAGLGAHASMLASLRDLLEARVLELVPRARIVGGGAARVPGTSLVTFPGAPADAIVFGLDLEGICASTGAACASGSTEPSHVVRAMGLAPEELGACVRFSLGAGNGEGDVERLVAVLAPLVERLRCA